MDGGGGKGLILGRARLGFLVCRYGELFGGKYPHPDVAAHPDVRPIQSGVYYCPDLRFAAFDVAWSRDGGDHKGENRVLSPQRWP